MLAIIITIKIRLEKYTWRHNIVLRSIFNTVKEKGLGNFKVYADIQEHTVAGGTLPPHIVITTQRPDLVAVWEDEKNTSFLLN